MNKKGHGAVAHIITTVLIIASIFASSFLTQYLYMQEQYRAYGSESNYEYIIGEQAKYYTEQIAKSGGEQADPSQNDEFASKGAITSPMTLAQVEEVKAGSQILGNPSAKITWIEYSDFNCGFCKRQHEEKTYQTVKAKFSNEELNFTYRPFAIFNEEAAGAVACIGDLAGSDAFYKAINQGFSVNRPGSSDFLAVAVEAGISEETYTACVNSDENKAKIKANLENGRSRFGIGGTPGNIIINNETGDFVYVNGAYPADVFEGKIRELLAK